MRKLGIGPMDTKFMGKSVQPDFTGSLDFEKVIHAIASSAR